MGRCATVTMVLVLAGTAAAKPLPANMKVTLKKGTPTISIDGTSVTLYDGYSQPAAISAELSDDGKAIVLKMDTCGMGLEFDEEGTSVPLSVIEARIDNAKGMKLHVKKKYADAAKLFASAVTKDPTEPLYATNLLSAQAMGAMLDDADKTLAAGKKHVGWFAWRLGVDPELKALKGRPSTAPFIATKPGTAKVKQLLADVVAVSPLGVAAVRTYTIDHSSSYVSFVELSTGAESLRLPVGGKSTKEIETLMTSLGMVKGAKLEYEPDGLPSDIDAKAAAKVGKQWVFTTRTGGCDVSDFEVRAGASTP